MINVKLRIEVSVAEHTMTEYCSMKVLEKKMIETETFLKEHIYNHSIDTVHMSTFQSLSIKYKALVDSYCSRKSEEQLGQEGTELNSWLDSGYNSWFNNLYVGQNVYILPLPVGSCFIKGYNKS